MLTLAHAGHWLVQALYVAPLVVLVGVIVWGRIRDRRLESEPPEDVSGAT